MRIESVDTTDPRDVVRGLRGAVLGAGPAIALGATADLRADSVVAPGTAVVLTTSGSTGIPKSVVLSRSALTSSALATLDHLGAGSWLLALPAGYIAGVQVVVRSLLAGQEPAILAGSFTPQTFAAAAGSMAASVGGQRTPTFTSLVPAQLQTLVAAEEAGQDTRIGSFEAILVGGQALSAALAERAAAVGARIVRTYGSTETSGGCVYDGRPLRDVAVRVRDGEVQLSGPMLADGYLGDPALTDSAFLRDADGVRWYRTGDAGAFDGLLRITGRLDNVIVSGGINVSLDRVEQVVRTVPGLDAAIVVAVPDSRWGEASAIVVDRADLRADVLDEARRAVAAAVGAPARPRDLIHVDAIPLLPSGKPDRRAVKALAVARDGSPGGGDAA